MSQLQQKHDYEKMAKLIIECRYLHKGRSIRAICRSHNIPISSYYYYCDKLNSMNKDKYDETFNFLYQGFVYDIVKDVNNWRADFHESYSSCCRLIRQKAEEMINVPVQDLNHKIFSEIVAWSKLSVETYIALEDIRQANILAGINDPNDNLRDDDKYDMSSFGL